MTLPESKSLDIREVAKMLGLRPQYGTGARGNWWCFCQTDGKHHDTPDLSFRGNRFMCFRCGTKGDTADLVAQSLGLTLPDALKWLADPDREIPVVDIAAIERERSSDKPAHFYAEIYGAFLERCVRLNHPGIIECTRDWFEDYRTVSLDAAMSFGIRFIYRTYRDVMCELEERFGGELVQESGLSAFYPYYKAGVGMLVIPYLSGDNQAPHYLKARPLLRDIPAGVPRFKNLRVGLPFPYNAPLTVGSHCPIIIVEGESDVWMLHDSGFDGSDSTLPIPVGIPGARSFREEWLVWFKGRRVYQFADMDKAGAECVANMGKMFVNAGMDAPKVVSVPLGEKDISDALKGVPRAERKGLVMEAIRE